MRRSTRESKPSLKIREILSGEAVLAMESALYAAVDESTVYGAPDLEGDPTSYDEAMQSEHKQEWMEAMRVEFEAHDDNGTFLVHDTSMVDPKTGMPYGAKERGAVLVGSTWVFKTKRDANGNITRRKARLCAQEYRDRGKKRAERKKRQESGTLGTGDYNDEVDLYAPVASKAGIRVVSALAASQEMLIYQLDVKTAYINADLEREVYMRVPDGMNVPAGSVIQLKKCLYGLRTSGNRWNNLLNSDLESYGYMRTTSDSSVYVRRDEMTGDSSYIAVVVDDVLIVAKRESEYKRVLKLLEEKYKMTDEGLLGYYVGIEVEQQRGEIILRQSRYTTTILERYGMADCKPVDTPLTEVKYSKGMSPKCDEERVQMERLDYRGCIGSLRYLADTTRPDIDEAVSKMSRYSNDPGMEHWMGVKRIMRFLKGTTEYGIRYTSGESTELHAYSDADYAGCVDSRRSVSGYIAMLAGGPVIWGSRKQQCVTLSTMEAEYVALSTTAIEVIWARTLLNELGVVQGNRTIIFGDNVVANLQSKRPGVTRKAKHIDIRYHFIRDCVARGAIDVKYVRSELNLADVFTKSLTTYKFRKLCAKFMYDSTGTLNRKADLFHVCFVK